MSRWGAGRPHPPGQNERVNEAFDAMVERFGGFVLLAIGIVALGVAVAGYYRVLPPPLSAPIFPARCMGCNQLTFLASILLRAGVICIGGGIVAIPHNRRNRDAWRRADESQGATVCTSTRDA